MSPISHLIFDFDGTLINSFDCAINVFNALAPIYHFRLIKPEDIEPLKNMDAKAFMHYFQIPTYKLPMLLHQATKQMQRNILNLHPFSGISKVLETLHTAGHQLSIVSSNSERNIQTWLDHHDLATYFSVIAQAPKYLNKAKTLKRIIKQSSFSRDRVYYIGDETRDIKAAKQAGVTAIAVTWGFHSEKIIMQYDPQYLVHKPEAILDIVLRNEILSK